MGLGEMGWQTENTLSDGQEAPEPQRPHLRRGARHPWISRGFRKTRGVPFVRHAAYEVGLQERAVVRPVCERKQIYHHVTGWMADWRVVTVLAKIKAEKHVLVAGGSVTCNQEAVLGDHSVDCAWGFGGRTEPEPVQQLSSQQAGDD